MASHGGSEGASGAVGGVGALPFGLENFLLDPSLVVKLSRSMAFSRCPPVITTAGAPISCSLAAAARISSRSVDLQPGQRGSFVDVGSDHVGQRNQLFDKKLGSGGIEQVSSRRRT